MFKAGSRAQGPQRDRHDYLSHRDDAEYDASTLLVQHGSNMNVNGCMPLSMRDSEYVLPIAVERPLAGKIPN